jgi:hypothetical protein
MIVRLLPTPEELTVVPPVDSDTDLQWAQGPPIATPEWVVASWKKAAASREAIAQQD